ncbi:Transcriptional regulator, LysR family [Marinobacterium lacunae]|uniref:Transcriptional regulator, LysR family n=1 Tax=Marinobacterium lacunae TaxID=1232683 RepID=A0A081FUR5_9GAMM|nr:LysR substrate-binding domain-containing protein [Marinobacterium lacunae]KEA62270.1 Transcriptional regulator, LysR family [Marinobacterium lacunae]
MSRDPSLNGMIYFESVARNGRVARAAEELNVSPSAVSQQIKLLEELLGISLFRREKRQLSLTAEGEQLYLAATSAFGILHNARQLISRHRESHQLIIRVTPSFAIRWLSPKLADFIQKNPEWDLRVDASPDPSNFEREVVDLDIRYGHSSLAGLHCEEVVSDYILPICSPAYRDELRRSCSSPLEMLQKIRLIDSVKAVMQWDNWLARHRVTRNNKDAALRFDRSSMAIQQAINGVGVVLESTTLTYDELRSGMLVPLAPEMGAIRFPAYRIVCPSRHRSRKLVQVFIGWILQQAEIHENNISALLSDKNVPVYDDPEVFSYLSDEKR